MHYQLIVSLVVVLTTLATLKYEMAILLPKKDSEAFSVAILALLVVVIFCVLLTVLLSLFYKPILVWFHLNYLSCYWWLVLLGLFVGAVVCVVDNSLIRLGCFRYISMLRVVQSLFQQGFFVVGGPSGAEFSNALLWSVIGTGYYNINDIAKSLGPLFFLGRK